MQTRCNRGLLLQILLLALACFGHHYAHHQELKSIIQWLLRVVFCAVKIRSAIKTSVAFSWHFISTYFPTGFLYLYCMISTTTGLFLYLSLTDSSLRWARGVFSANPYKLFPTPKTVTTTDLD